ncbi:MAG TPA: hypothetical protein VFE88_03185 [Candidatus Nanoarchaeia archaeon]|nr:hypothetical protein [Candidatus Nanoarchaeia archaeon]
MEVAGVKVIKKSCSEKGVGLLGFFKKKREEDLGLDLEPAEPLDEEPLRPAFDREPERALADGEMSLVLAKLDLINQRLENIDLRLREIEKIAKSS